MASGPPRQPKRPETVPEPSCRFSPPDWEHQDYEWSETAGDWGDRLVEAVSGLPRAQWDQAWERFAQAMLTIAAGVRATLVADGTLPADVVVYLDDEDGDLLVRSLTSAELQRHFPEYVAAAAAEHAILALPVEQRVAALAAAAGLVPGPPGDLGQERARALLLELGGASAASRQRNLDRHWRNIRTITLHNPVGYKARVVGQNLLHGTAIPANAYF